MTPGETMDHDYRSLVQDELVDLRDFLTDLAPGDWDHPSLCEGWAVRNVVGHICLAYHKSVPYIAWQVVLAGGNVARASSQKSKEFGDEHSPDELLALFSEYVDHSDHPKHLARFLPVRDRMADHLIHHEDCRRGLGRDREIPAERLTAALDALPAIGGFLNSKKMCHALSFEASDLDWSSGDGPLVRGPGRDLVLAMSGRPLGLDTLEGEGVEILSARVKG